MAKRIDRIKVEIMVDLVSGTYQTRDCFFSVGDDTIPNVTYSDIVGPNPCPPSPIEASDLSGTLQEYLDFIKASIEDQEGIA